MTCKQCKNYDECQFNAACNNAVFDPDVSAEYCTGAEPITNADRFRAMSDDEQQKCVRRFFEVEDFADWLQQPAGEEQNG